MSTVNNTKDRSELDAAIQELFTRPYCEEAGNLTSPDLLIPGVYGQFLNPNPYDKTIKSSSESQPWVMWLSSQNARFNPPDQNEEDYLDLIGSDGGYVHILSPTGNNRPQTFEITDDCGNLVAGLKADFEALNQLYAIPSGNYTYLLRRPLYTPQQNTSSTPFLLETTPLITEEIVQPPALTPPMIGAVIVGIFALLGWLVLYFGVFRGSKGTFERSLDEMERDYICKLERKGFRVHKFMNCQGDGMITRVNGEQQNKQWEEVEVWKHFVPQEDRERRGAGFSKVKAGQGRWGDEYGLGGHEHVAIAR